MIDVNLYTHQYDPYYKGIGWVKYYTLMNEYHNNRNYIIRNQRKPRNVPMMSLELYE